MRIGIYNRWLSTLGGGEKLCLTIAEHLSQTNEVAVLSPTKVSPEEVRNKLNVDLSNVKIEIVPANQLTQRTRSFDLFINASQGDFVASNAKRNVMLVYFPTPIYFSQKERFRQTIANIVKRLLVVPELGVDDLSPNIQTDARAKLYRAVFEQWLPSWGARLRASPSDPSAFPKILDTYQHIWAISAYSASWVERLWNRHSEIIHPIVDVDHFSTEEKKNRILSVGRFFAGNHNKKHLDMIDAFRRMNLESLKDWELHLVGGTRPEPEHQAYLDRVKSAATGLPIHIHENVAFVKLKSIYASSAIYWHAAGYGEDESRNPIAAEHFGISTVEAMAASCVPVVIDRGGQREIITHNRNGMLWQTIDQLQSYTLQLIHDLTLRKTLSLQAQQDCQKFSKSAFVARLEALLSQFATN
jgi:glycosyltransferase involved in cell wall biosynthesis